MSDDAAVLVTGSAGGIGQALVRAFSDSGYFVVGMDLKATPGADHSLEFDLARLAADEGALVAVRESVAAALDGRSLAALVNNAAIQVLGSVEELSVADFRATMDVNLVAGFALVKVALPHLEASSGSVINIGSIHGRLTKPHFAAYATSKGALETLTRALAVELGSRVRINAISPAAIETPMLRAGFEGAPEAYRALAMCHPAGRVGTTKEIARLAVFLAGDSEVFLNGAVIDIDGGIGGRLHDPV